MKKFLLLVLLACYGPLFGQQSIKKRSFSLSPGLSAADYMPGIVIIKLKPVAGPVKFKQAPSIRQSLPNNLTDITLKSATVKSVVKKFPEGDNTNISAQSEASGLNRIYELKFNGTSIEAVINELLQDERIEYAEPSYIYHSNYIPNDPSYPNQNWLNQVRAPQAWDIIRNASGVIIAIVDSGSELVHQDLASNIYLNTADPINGTDDDHDGYVDNFRGWDLVGASASQIIEDNDPSIKSAGADHGVHVSGIASAVTDNNTGVASIAFNAKLMIIKAGADDNGESIYRGYDGIKYAADHGAQIINCSWGGEGGGSYGLDIINYALSKGCLIIAAAGNSGVSVPEYPAAYPGVIAVANVNSADVKASSSNFGSYVSVSAPGSSILSTTFGNSYGVKSGTSMAAPMVASAAALVKSFFPSLTMQQVGEKLRATSDNIDPFNPNYAGQLGKGRINVFRALTESPPSIRNQKLTIVDAGNGSIPAGQTVDLYFELKNFLSPVTNLQVTLSSANSSVTVTQATQTVASIGTLQTHAMTGPFKVLVKPGTPDNTEVIFKLAYSANSGTYQDFETFTLTVALDYINIEVNKVATTLTSNGRVGFSSGNSTNGLGFSYLNQQLLYEASLMIGTSSLQVSNNTRTGNGNDEHFVKQVRAVKTATTTAAFEGRSEFDDSGSPNRLNVYVKHRQLAWATAPDDKYTIAEYEVVNTTTAALNNVYIGLFTDWDVDDGSTNITRYDAANRMGYVQRKSGGSPMGAVKLLSTNGSPVYYPLSYNVSGDPLADGSFTIAEKYQTLSSGIKATSLGDTGSGYDVMFVSGYGPFNIPAKGSVRVAFAFMGGEDLTDLQKSAAAAQTKYNLIKPIDAPISASLELKQNYPNPFPSANSTTTTIQYSIPESGDVSLALYDVLGRKVKMYVNEFAAAGLHTLNLSSQELENGIYFYRINFKGEQKALKLVIAR